jgi:hypothetical protein
VSVTGATLVLARVLLTGNSAPLIWYAHAKADQFTEMHACPRTLCGPHSRTWGGRVTTLTIAGLEVLDGVDALARDAAGQGRTLDR